MKPTESHFNLHAIVRRIVMEHGFVIDFPPDALKQAEQLSDQPPVGSQDLRHLLWSSIDNDDSRDLDQIEYVETKGDSVRLLIAIADVSSAVPLSSPIDKVAHANTTSVYTGIETYPMLPQRLSTNLTSLLENVDRAAVVTDMLIDSSGHMTESTVYPALVRNKAQLTYDAVAIWIEGRSDATATLIGRQSLEKIRGNAELREQIRIQDELAQRFLKIRTDAGALTLGMSELRPSLSDGEVHMDVHVANRATELIENFMIASNQAVVSFLEKNKWPVIRRVVRTPKRWDRIVELAASKGFTLPAEPNSKALEDFLSQQRIKEPDLFSELSLSVVKLLGRGEYVVQHPGETGEGHFGLAVEGYAHSTAPNRRYPDIVTQRLLLALCGKSPLPYSIDALDEVARHCTEREDQANKTERAVRKSMAAVVLSKRIGETFSAIVTGKSTAGVWVRVKNPPIEGRLNNPPVHLDVGDSLNVRLVSTDPNRGYIDFSAI